MNTTPKVIAETILSAATIRENSYNSFTHKYEKHLCYAVEQAAQLERLPLELASPIYLSMYWWNDAIDWAQEILTYSKQTTLGGTNHASCNNNSTK